MANLLAVCRVNGQLAVKRVRINQQVQDQISGIFEAYEQDFMADVAEENVFDCDWKADNDELLLIRNDAEVQAVQDAAEQNPIALPDVDTHNFSRENIKAVFVVKQADGGGANRLLMQNFSLQQVLNHKIAFLQDGNSFKRLTENAFTLGSGITAVIEGGVLKFKSFSRIKQIFNLAGLYQVASDEQIEAMARHSSLEVADIAQFKSNSDQVIRKLVYAVSQSGILNSPIDAIVEKAALLGLNLQTNNGKIILPSDRRALKLFFRFLDDGIYEAPLSLRKYQTNSKRVIGA